MAHDDTGTLWDTTSPANGELVENGALEIRDLRKAVGIRANKEHVSYGTASAGGEHKAGSAVAYYQSSNPTQRPDAATSLNASDNGRILVRSDTKKPYVWVNGTGWVALELKSDSFAIIEDQKVSGSNGGSSSGGTYVVRELNTEVSDVDGIVSLPGSNRFRLQAGTYEFFARVPGYRCDGHQAVLYNVTDLAITARGSSVYAWEGGNGSSDSIINTKFTIAGQKDFEIRHYTETTKATFGLGNGGGFGTEVFTSLFIRKIVT